MVMLLLMGVIFAAWALLFIFISHMIGKLGKQSIYIN